jgi:hypothetical protein
VYKWTDVAIGDVWRGSSSQGEKQEWDGLARTLAIEREIIG